MSGKVKALPLRTLGALFVFGLLCTAVTPHLPTSIDFLGGDDRAKDLPSNDGTGMDVGTNVRSYLDLRGSFIENKGQIDNDLVRYYVLGDNLEVYFTTGGLKYLISSEVQGPSTLVELEFVQANDAPPVGMSPLGHVYNFFKGKDPQRWARGVSNFEEVVYQDLWTGIDLRYRIEGGKLKYEYEVWPGGDPSDIAVQYKGADRLSLDRTTHDLIIQTPIATVVDAAPVAFQDLNGNRTIVECDYMNEGESTVTFNMGRYDPALPLVIDPGLELCTYLGGNKVDRLFGGDLMALGPDGSIHIVGWTGSDNFPVTLNAYCNTFHSDSTWDGFLAKFNANGTALEYCTYFGSEMWDDARSVYVDDAGMIYIAGCAGADDFPTTPGAYCETSSGGGDAYLAKFDSSGSNLLYSTLIGGSNTDGCWDLEVDQDENAYLAIFTYSDDFPVTPNAYCSTLNGTRSDLVVVKFSLRTNQLVYSTYVGGDDEEAVFDIEVDEEGYAYVSGLTQSGVFPTTTISFDSTFNGGGTDGFLLKLSKDGTSLEFSTYFGGSDGDSPSGIVLASNGSVWLHGSTQSNDLPITKDAFPDRLGGGEVIGFFSRFSSDGSVLEYSTYFGISNSNTWLYGFALNDHNEPIVVSRVISKDLVCPTGALYPRHHGGTTDVYIAWLDTTNTSYINATYFGGSGFEDFDLNVLIPSDGTALICGETASNDLPTTQGCFDPTYDNMYDIFVARISMGRTPWIPPGQPTNLTANPGDSLVELQWEPPADNDGWFIKGYRIRYKEIDGNSTKEHQVIGLAKAIIGGLENGKDYTFNVTAISVVGEGPRSASVTSTPFGIPTGPLNFTATADLGEVHLRWTPPLDDGVIPLLGYRLYRGTTQASMTPLVDLALELGYIDADVEVGTTYYYSVAAFHEYIEGEHSVVRTTIPFGPPEAPRELGIDPGNEMVRLTWSPPLFDGALPIEEYRVYRGHTADGLTVIAHVDVGTMFTDTEVVNGLTYFYAVSAVNAAVEGPQSNVVKAKPLGPPSHPRDLAFKEGDGQVTLSWKRPDDLGGGMILEYRVLRGTSADDLQLLTTVTDGTTFTDEDVENGMTYHYLVKAVNEAGPGFATVIVQATPMGRPGPPRGLVTVAGENQVELLWLPPSETGGSDLTQYMIYRGTSEDALVLVTETSTLSQRHLDIQLEAGITYFYEVSAMNTRHEGPLSDTVSATPIGLPGPPTNVLAQAGDGEVTLSWERPLLDGGSTIRGYVLHWGTDPEALTERSQYGETYLGTLHGLENGVTYHIAVSALNELGEGPMADAIPITPVGLPGMPTIQDAVVVGGSVTITWEGPEDDGGTPVLAFVLLRGTSPDDLQSLTELGVINSYTDVDVEPGMTYYYGLLARNAIGPGGVSTVVKVDVGSKQEAMPPPTLPSWAPLVAFAVVIIGLAAAASTESGKYQLALVTTPLMTRSSKEEVLNNKNRYAIHGMIIDRPGIHFNELLREFPLTVGVVTYHLNVLEKENFIRSVRDGRLKRFYSTHAKVPREHRLTPEEIREAVRTLVKERPGISQMEIIEELGVDRDTVGYHLREMVKGGTMSSSKQGKYTVYQVNDGHRH